MEHKQCARCNQDFECQPMNITNCQCSRIQLSENERIFIKTHFADCLCIDCLSALKSEYEKL